jgi:SsrA-binding protein
VRPGEVWLEGMNISPYESAGYATHVPARSRKLLLHTRQIRRLIGGVEQEGLTLGPLDLHFTRGRAKVTLALAKGKKLHDRREDLKRRTAERGRRAPSDGGDESPAAARDGRRRVGNQPERIGRRSR